jgi:hypothetical protein
MLIVEPSGNVYVYEGLLSRFGKIGSGAGNPSVDGAGP